MDKITLKETYFNESFSNKWPHFGISFVYDNQAIPDNNCKNFFLLLLTDFAIEKNSMQT